MVGPCARLLLLVVVSVRASMGAVLAADPAPPPAPALGSGGLPKSFDLKKQLELGLKARRPSDFAYIAKVVSRVENGTLPRTVVDQAFMYARGRHKEYPIVYFQFSLKELAKKAGTPL